MTSYRVELVTERNSDETEKRGCCASTNALFGDTTMVINRDLPPIIENTNVLHQSSWIDFCDKIDAALIPLARLKKRNARYSLFLIIISLCLFMSSPIVIYLNEKRRPVDTDNSNSAERGDSSEEYEEQENNEQDNYSSNTSVWPQVIMVVFLLIPLFGLCYLASSGKDRDELVCNELYEICREASGPPYNENIQFLFKREIVYSGPKRRARVRKYIELKIEGVNDIEAIPTGRDRALLLQGRPSTPDTACSIESNNNSTL